MALWPENYVCTINDRSWYFTIINLWSYVFSDKKTDPIKLDNLPTFSTPSKGQVRFGPKSVSQAQALCIISRNNGVWRRKWQVPTGTVFETPWDLGKESPLARKMPWHSYPPGLSNNIQVSPRAFSPAHLPVGVGHGGVLYLCAMRPESHRRLGLGISVEESTVAWWIRKHAKVLPVSPK